MFGRGATRVHHRPGVHRRRQRCSRRRRQGVGRSAFKHSPGAGRRLQVVVVGTFGSGAFDHLAVVVGEGAFGFVALRGDGLGFEAIGFGRRSVRGRGGVVVFSPLLLREGLGIFFVPERRMKRIRQQAKALLSSRAKHCSTVDSLWLAQFAGLAISTWLAVPQARYRVRPMFDDLVRGGAYRKRFRGSVRLSRETVRMIMWWRDLVSNPAVGRTVWRPLVDTTICTDASTSIGWGGTFGDGRHRNVL